MVPNDPLDAMMLITLSGRNCSAVLVTVYSTTSDPTATELMTICDAGRARRMARSWRSFSISDALIAAVVTTAHAEPERRNMCTET